MQAQSEFDRNESLECIFSEITLILVYEYFKAFVQMRLLFKCKNDQNWFYFFAK